MSASEMTIGTVLRAHAPRAPESLRTRVLAFEPSRAPSRRLVLVLALALAGAVAAAIVHGVLSSSGSQPQQVAVRGGVPHVKRALAPDLHPPVDSSGGSGGATWAQALPSVAGGPALPSVAGAPTRLQHTDASLEVRVKNTSAATTRATRIATSLGGYAQSVNYNSAPGGGGTASIVLRVPAQNVKAALARLEGLGTLVSQNLSVTDLEHDLQLESAQIAQLRRTIAALRTALNNPSLPDAQRVILQIRLAESKRALSQRLHARSGTIAAGTTSRISLFLSTRNAVAPVPHHRGRLGRMVHSAVGFLGLEGTIVLYALIVLSPVALVGALLWSLREARRRRDERLVME
ncbi:MAG TPA: DUF4349 domain-containing protein [Gaiellaceae bacterium]|jgi:hypothetical protein|nr:DUF4349 domain-containing protein [Gaiellaceae bacterium]